MSIACIARAPFAPENGPFREKGPSTAVFVAASGAALARIPWAITGTAAL